MNFLRIFFYLTRFGSKNILDLIEDRDLLTGAYNCKGFFSQVEKERKKMAHMGGFFSVIYLEIGAEYYEKLFNQKKVDKFVRMIAAQIRGSISGTDIFARSGNKFFIFMPGTSYKDAFRVASELSGKRVTCGVSFSNNDDKRSVISLLAEAEKRTYKRHLLKVA